MSASQGIGSREIAKPRGRVLPFPVSGQEFVLLGVIVLLWVALGFAAPGFVTGGSIRPLLSSVAPIAIMGVGMTIVIITGGIDLSVSGMLAVAAVVAAKVMVAFGSPPLVTLLVGVVVGGALGLVNGLLIAVGRVHALIITFGTWNVFLFVGYRIFDGQFVNNIPRTLEPLGAGPNGAIWGVPTSFILMILIAGGAWCYLRYTAGGRHYYAIGSDAVAARLAGIPVQHRIASAYVLSGLLVGIGACLTLANGTQSLAPTVGRGTELAVIAAVVIGGTSIMGGSGSVLGTVLGAILVQTVASGVTQLSWPSQLANLFVGLFVIIAVGTDLLRQRLGRKA